MAGPVDASPYGAPPEDPTAEPVEVLLTPVDASVPSSAHPGDAGVDLSCTDGIVLASGHGSL